MKEKREQVRVINNIENKNIDNQYKNNLKEKINNNQYNNNENKINNLSNENLINQNQYINNNYSNCNQYNNSENNINNFSNENIINANENLSNQNQYINNIYSNCNQYNNNENNINNFSNENIIDANENLINQNQYINNNHSNCNQYNNANYSNKGYDNYSNQYLNNNQNQNNNNSNKKINNNQFNNKNDSNNNHSNYKSNSNDNCVKGCVSDSFDVIDGVIYDENGDAVFTKENKSDYTLLIPTMLPIHFGLIKHLLVSFGYKAEMLCGESLTAGETGLKYVHNDTCYPATLIIGEFIEALQSGKYDTHKVAVVISQTGGGCRASNYLFLLKKALKRAGFGYVPVLSFNLSGLKTQPGFKLGVSQIMGLLKCVLYGDLLMQLKNQCEPYEVQKGETEKLVNFWVCVLGGEFFNKKNLRYVHMKDNYKKIIQSFNEIELNKGEKKVKVGIVGEIFVKYSPLANNGLEKFLIGEGAEVYVP
ncbi:MAG: hypothetical protein ACI4TX_04115, partial [Christensenellales bacterium]